MLKPKGHQLVLVRGYKTLNEWFKELCLDDKLDLYEYKIKLDSGRYVKIQPIDHVEVQVGGEKKK